MQLKKNKYVYLLGGLLLLYACSKAPSGILSEKKMQAVLTDMQIAEAMIGVDYKAYQDSGYKEALYESVFQKHKITQATYDSSLVWYGKNLDVFMKMYERVRNDLDEQLRGLGNVQASATTSTKNDSVDIWPRRPYFIFTPEAPFNGLTFDIKPQRNYSSGSRFVLGMRVWGINSNMTHFPEVRISIVQADTVITVNNVITTDGYHKTTIQSMPTRQVKEVYGVIRLDNTDANYFRIYTDSLNLMRYNYRSDFTQAADSTSVEATDTPQ
ncbi:MAG: DUF4296 domain-containing protein [Tannerellaceae bacterium]|nr:DUF4296 domain-containing protein [Tannerellaceae bacterium]